MRRFLWLAGALVALVIVATIGGGLYIRQQLRASLPIESGTLHVEGLSAPVTIGRDGFGVPTITAGSRADAARALGFLHGQERFFQMDLQRRQAAGELSALVGARALEADRSTRVHRFRHRAQQALGAATPEYRSLLEAYAGGVNAGLHALGAPPFEYLLLRATPLDWKAEDSLLTVLAMFNTLQGRQAAFEATFGTLHDTVPPAMFDFLTARGSEWDAPVMGDRFPRPAIPGADVFDLRRGHIATDARRRGEDDFSTAPNVLSRMFLRASVPPWPLPLTREEESGLGSNNWAVDGAHSATGAALVANDMHLAINVPNIWYRASMIVPDLRVAGQSLRLTGVTLPGLPTLVVGSNGHVAWGFTNTGGDWSDLVIVEIDPRDKSQYLTSDGPRPIERIAETIEVSGGAAETIEVQQTMWGPIIRNDHRGRPMAQRWVAHDWTRLSVDASGPEPARTVEELLSVATGLGMPAQNFVAADTTGRIGWTISGPMPRREGFDGSVPTSWADGSRRWNGYLAPDEYPRILAPATGRIWTANSPVVDGELLKTIGEGGYADGIRARLIRDRLLAIEKATPADMLAVQLDTTALFLERWRTLVLEALTPAVAQAHPRRAEFRRLVETTWTGQADPQSTAYLFVRSFRAALSRDVFGAITDAITRQDSTFDYTRTLRSEGPLWQLVTERPLNLLNPRFSTWDAQLVAAVDAAIADLTTDGKSLIDHTWGTFNRATVAHPLGAALPLVGQFVNMPSDPLPGDIYTPRAHSPRAGPSERMVVSPGREEEGILHMPTGQSGHPLSPHYADQHRAWLSGEPLPFLPGPAVTTLTLTSTPP